MRTSAGQVLRQLAWPIYVPTMLYSAGAAAIIPVVPLFALRLGFDAAQTALIVTATVAFAAFGPLPAGLLMVRIGERVGLIGGAAIAIGGALGSAAAAAGLVPAPAPVFIACLFVMAAGDLLWDLGRQTYLADKVPAAARARAMSMFGGTQRLGRVAGPAVGGAVLLVGDIAAVFVVHALLGLAALVLVARFVVPAPREASVGTTSSDAEARVSLAPLVLVAIGVAALSLGRTARDVLVPLVGHANGYNEASISLVFAVAAAAELVLFLPGGAIMDRHGRLAVLAPSMVGLGVPLALVPFAPGFGWFTAAVVAMGIANGLGAGINKTLSVDYTPARNRARYLGYWNTITGLGSLAGPGVIAAVTAAASLGLACVTCGAATVAGAGWAAFWMRRFPRRG